MEKYDKYIKELNQKVERQRDQQKKRDEEFEERLKQLQEDVSLHKGQIQWKTKNIKLSK